MRGGGLFSANGTGSEGKGGGRREERGKYTSGLGKGLQREMQQMKVGDKEALTAILDGKKGGEKGYRAYDTEDEQRFLETGRGVNSYFRENAEGNRTVDRGRKPGMGIGIYCKRNIFGRS